MGEDFRYYHCTQGPCSRCSGESGLWRSEWEEQKILFARKHRFSFSFLIHSQPSRSTGLLLHPVDHGALLPDYIHHSRETVSLQGSAEMKTSFFLSKNHVQLFPPHSVWGSRAPFIPLVEVMVIFSFHGHREWVIFVACLKSSKNGWFFGLVHVSIAQAANQIPS